MKLDCRSDGSLPQELQDSKYQTLKSSCSLEKQGLQETTQEQCGSMSGAFRRFLKL
jgi:hypothetical protein